MSIDELKQIIHEGVENIDDLETLALMQDIIKRKYSVDSKNTITSEMAARLDAAQKDVDNGNFFTNEEANQKLEEWFQKE